jgi:uncharacterized protein (DUF952 family)
VTRPTFHLVPDEVWAAADPTGPYRARSLETDGFIHCTDGADELVATANRHFLADPRPYLVLTIDLEAAGSPWRIDDPRGVYPHVFGPIDRSAIVAIARMERAPDGWFQAIGPLPEA